MSRIWIVLQILAVVGSNSCRLQDRPSVRRRNCCVLLALCAFAPAFKLHSSKVAGWSRLRRPTPRISAASPRACG